MKVRTALVPRSFFFFWRKIIARLEGRRGGGNLGSVHVASANIFVVRT